MTMSPIRVHILLTATVDVGGIGLMQRSDPLVRMKDYQRALAWWDQVQGTHAPDSIMVCENSATDITPHSGGTWKQLCVHAWSGQDFPRHLGKGYGEMQTISTALSQYGAAWGEQDWLIKCNGRYIVPSIKRLCRHIRQLKDESLVADMTRNQTWCDSRLFAARVSCWKKYIIPTLPRLNDSTGSAFEYALAQAAHALMADGGRFALLPFIPRIIGVSGSTGSTYHSPLPILKLTVKQMLYPLKRAAFRV